MPLIFGELRCGLISQLIVNFNLITSHLDILLDDAHLLLLFGSLEAEVVLVLIALCMDALWNLRVLDRSSRLARNLLVFFELIQHLVGLQINLVLLIELYVKADHVCDRAQDACVQERFKLRAQSALDQANDSLRCSSLFTLCQCLHCASNQNELLLEVIEAYNAVDLVPVINAGLQRCIRGQA